MGVLSRHFVARFLSTFAASVLILTLSILTVETLTDLHLAVGDEGGWAVLLRRSALQISAHYLPYLVPLGAFAAAFVRFGGAARRSEIVAAKAGGISPIGLATPIFGAALALALLSLLANELFSVPARAALQQTKRGDRDGMSFRQGAFWYAEGARVFRVESANERAQVLNGVTIFERDERGRLARRIRATRLESIDRERWLAEDVEVLRIDPDQPGAASALETHKSLVLELGNRQALLDANPEFLPLPALRGYAAGRKSNTAQALRARTLIHQRLTDPLATLPFVVLAAALGLRAEGSRSLARAALPGVVVVLAYLFVRHYGGVLSKQGLWSPLIGAWGSLAILVLIAVDQLRRVPR